LQARHAKAHVLESAHGSIEEFNRKCERRAVNAVSDPVDAEHLTEQLIANHTRRNHVVRGFDGLIDAEDSGAPARLLFRALNVIFDRKTLPGKMELLIRHIVPSRCATEV